MRRVHMHMPAWAHPHSPDWHTVGVHLGRMVHDPRFWAALALAVLLGAMILAALLAKSRNTHGTRLSDLSLYAITECENINIMPASEPVA